MVVFFFLPPAEFLSNHFIMNSTTETSYNRTVHIPCLEVARRVFNLTKEDGRVIRTALGYEGHEKLILLHERFLSEFERLDLDDYYEALCTILNTPPQPDIVEGVVMVQIQTEEVDHPMTVLIKASKALHLDLDEQHNTAYNAYKGLMAGKLGRLKQATLTEEEFTLARDNNFKREFLVKPREQFL